MANRVTRFPALGTTAVLLVADERARGTALRILEGELGEIDASCSRFRDDSDLMRVNAASGQWVRVGARCIEAIEVALRAARATDGLVDPTIGRSLRVLG